MRNSNLKAAVAALLAVAAAALWPAPASAKSIGLVMPVCCDFGEPTKNKFVGYLQQAGLAPGQADVLLQRPGADKVSLLNSIRKLLAYETDVLVVFGASAAREAMNETRKVPVVFIGAYDPVRQGLAQSEEHPGQNATGVTCRTRMDFLLDNIQETVQLGTLGVLYHSDNMDSTAQLAELQGLAGKRGFKLVTADLREMSSDRAASSLQPAQFIYLAAGCYPDFLGQGLVSGLNRPVATQCAPVEGMDAVFSLSADGEETLAAAARLTVEILKGRSPSQMPVVSARKINFVINLGTAQRQGLKVPFGVLNRASRIIQ